LSLPARDRRHIARLFRDRLNEIDPGFGIDGFLLAADHVGVIDTVQANLAAGMTGGGVQSDDAGLSALVDRLANRLGEANIFRLAPVASHMPERACRPQPVLAASGNTLMWQDEAASPIPVLQRPFRLFQRPEPVEAVAAVPDGPPLRFTWRRVARAVMRSSGPERIEPEWWRGGAGMPGDRVRDYYAVEDRQGRRYWMFRAGHYDEGRAPQWYVHGVFG
jgi:protein ImuB